MSNLAIFNVVSTLVPSKFRQYLCLLLIIMMTCFLVRDVIIDRDIATGISYFLSGLGLLFMAIFGLAGYKETTFALAIGFITACASLFSTYSSSVLGSDEGAHYPAAVHQILLDISLGQGLASDGSFELQNQASTFLSEGKCETYTELSMSDVAAKIWMAIRLEPEVDALMRILNGKPPTPQNWCKIYIEKLQKLQPELISRYKLLKS